MGWVKPRAAAANRVRGSDVGDRAYVIFGARSGAVR